MKNSIPAIILILAYSLTEYGSAQSNRCGLGKFRCKNSECISSELLCDGQGDCADQSDETAEECDKPEIPCGDYLFRCSYGACVSGNAPCNGIKDCVDNSDETLPRCRRDSSNTTRTCRQNEFKCDNGQCIDQNGLCDGEANCADVSDETYIQCGTIPCTEYAFRCKYGACIKGDFKCNGLNDCVDGSDEDPELCNIPTRPRPAPTTRRPAPFPPTRRPPPTSPTPTVKPLPGCVVPRQPKNGYFKLQKSQCPQTDEDCDITQGIQLSPGANLIYGCNRGYKLDRHGSVFCAQNGKWSDTPECIEIRCRSLNSLSVIAECTDLNGISSTCNDITYPIGTTATLKCRPGYRPDLQGSPADIYRCNTTGQWHPVPNHCIPVCGVMGSGVNVTPAIVGGTPARVSEFPWHATIYLAKEPNGPKEFICGASIIKENFLITAAHCVFDQQQRLRDPSQFYIATGNIFRDYDYEFHNSNVKKSRVKAVYPYCDYLGVASNYLSDIAILEIEEPFQFTHILRPICFDEPENTDDLQSGELGRVAGFGRTRHGNSSFILQAINVPYIENLDCKKVLRNVTKESEKYISIDKFCAGYTNGSAVCNGDSGGGLVFQRGEVWFLKGIVSVSLGTKVEGGDRICDNYSYTLYTRVFSHVYLKWIRDVISKSRSC